MSLTREEAKQFEELFSGLVYYAAQIEFPHIKLPKERFTTFAAMQSAFGGGHQGMSTINKIKAYFYGENHGLFQQFVDKNPFSFDEEALEMVGNWQYHVSGIFQVVGHVDGNLLALREVSKDAMRRGVYLVHGINNPVTDIIPPYAIAENVEEAVIKCTLLPFGKDRITYDGMLMPVQPVPPTLRFKGGLIPNKELKKRMKGAGDLIVSARRSISFLDINQPMSSTVHEMTENSRRSEHMAQRVIDDPFLNSLGDVIKGGDIEQLSALLGEPPLKRSTVVACFNLIGSAAPDPLAVLNLLYNEKKVCKKTTDTASITSMPCFTGSATRAKLLLDAGIKFTSDGIQGPGTPSAFFIACQEGHTEVIRTILNYSDEYKALITVEVVKVSTCAGQLPVLKILREFMGSDEELHKPDEKGCTALGIAVENGHTDIIRWLVAHGADVACRDSDMWTMPMVAAQNGKLASLIVLKELGADLTARHPDGRTPRSLVMQIDPRMQNPVTAQLVGLLTSCGEPKPFDETDHCHWCDTKVEDAPNQKLLRCAGCRWAYYCSPKCQKAHWKHYHKEMCKAYKDMYKR